MNRKIVAGLALALIVSISAFAVVTTVHTDEFFESDAATTITYSYDAVAKTATVTGISGVDANTEIYIPAEVSYEGSSYHVTKILGNALNWPKANAGASLKIGQPDSPVKSIEIESGAFSQVNTLTTVEIYGNVSIIGGSAFSQTSNLETFSVYGDVGSIGGNAFQQSAVRSLLFGGSVGTLETESFGGLTSIVSFYVDRDIDTIEGNAFRSAGSANSAYPFIFTVGGSIKTIESYAFGMSNLAHFSVGDTIGSIGAEAFHSTQKLVSVDMGDTDIIYRAAFYNSNVKDITLSNNTQLQGDSIFQGVNLDSLYLTGTASDEGGDILSNFFTLPWVLCHDNTVGTLIIDDVSRLNDIAAGGDVVHYDESTGESVLYRNDGDNWVPIITENGPVSVLFDPQSDSESVSVKVIPYGGKTIFPTPYKHGHTFIGWFTKAVGGIQMESNVSTFTEDTTLYAQWELADLVMCKIVYDLDGGAGTAPAAVFAQSNTQITLASYDGVKEDFVFAGWSDGTSTYAPGSAYLVNELNIVLKAVWVPESTSQDVVVEVIGIGVDSVDSADLYLNDSEIPVVILGGTFSMNTDDVLTIVTEGGYTYFTAGFIETDGICTPDPSASVFRVYILEELVFIDPNLLFAVIHTSSDTASLDLSDYEAYDEIEHWFVAGTGVIVHVDNDELLLTVPPGLIGTVPVVVTLSDGNGSLLYCHILLAILPGIGFIIPPA